MMNMFGSVVAAAVAVYTLCKGGAQSTTLIVVEASRHLRPKTVRSVTSVANLGKEAAASMRVMFISPRVRINKRTCFALATICR